MTKKNTTLHSFARLFAVLAFVFVLAGIIITAFNRFQTAKAADTTTGNTTNTGNTNTSGTVSSFPATTKSALGVYQLAAVASGGSMAAYINWDFQDLMLQSTLNDEYFYISDAKMKTWDEVTASKGLATCDLSWINKAYELNIKGDKDPNNIMKISIEAPRQLKAKFAMVNEQPTLTLTLTETINKKKVKTELSAASTAGIQWRKGTVGIWNDYNTLDMDSFMTKGGTINLRLKGEISADGKTTYLPSKVGSVKIAKRANAPSVKVDATKLTLGVKKGMEYMVTTATSASAIIVLTDTAQKDPSLAQMGGGILEGDGYSKPFPAFYVKARKSSTAKKAASKWTTLSYPAQRTPTSSALTVSLTDKGASLNNATTYDIQYFVPNSNTIQTIHAAAFDAKTKWKTIKAGKSGTFKNGSAGNVSSGTAIFMRDAAIKDVTKTPENEAELPSTVCIVKPK